MSDLFFGEFSTDVTPPEVTNAEPTGIGVLKTTPVEFDITDTETGVDTSSVIVVIGGTTAFSGGSVQNGFIGGLAGPVGGTYHMTLTPPADWGSYDTVNVTVDGQDLAPSPNVMAQYGWSFLVEDYEAPYVDAGWSPTGATEPTTVLIDFYLKDDGAGVDLASAIVTVGGVPAYNGGLAPAFRPGFQGLSSAVTGTPANYHFVIDAFPNFDEGVSYEVIVNADDLVA